MDRTHLHEVLPPYRESMARGDWEGALRLLEEKGGAQGERLAPAEAMDLAAIHGLQGRTDAAAALLARLAESRDARLAAEAVLRLASLYVSDDSRREEAARLLDRVVSLGGDDPKIRGMTAHLRSRLMWKAGNVGEAGRLLEQARTLLGKAGAEEELAKVLDSCAMLHDHRGEPREAVTCYTLSLAKKALHRDLVGIGITLGNLGRFHLRGGAPAIALPLFEEDLRIAESLSDRTASVTLKIMPVLALAFVRTRTTVLLCNLAELPSTSSATWSQS